MLGSAGFAGVAPNIASLGNRISMIFGKRPPCIDCRVENSSGHIRAFVKSDLEK